jgi:hypothetical protein
LTIFAAVLAVAALSWVSPAAAQEESTTITMDALNDSGVSGEATLTAAGEETVVSVALDGATGDHPAHIHMGTCDTLNPNPEYVLTDIDADGASETTVPVALSDLLASEYAINVHLSVDEIETYVSCGTIVASDTGGTDTAAAGGTTSTTPSTGVGVTAMTNGTNAMLLGLAALAVVLGGAGYALRRSAVRS